MTTAATPGSAQIQIRLDNLATGIHDACLVFTGDLHRQLLAQVTGAPVGRPCS